MPKITQLFAFIADEDDKGNQGIMAFNDGHGWMPMIGSDLGRIKQLKPIADQIKGLTGKPYRIMKFKYAGDYEKNSMS